jgi:hypothetical protein
VSIFLLVLDSGYWSHRRGATCSKEDRMRSPMFSNLGSALRNANAESALYRRWFPGSGQRGGGFAGMGLCDPSDPTCGVIDTVTSTDPVTPFDPLATDPLIPDEAGNVCLASMFVNGQCPAALPVDPSLLYGGPTNNYTGAPAPVLTPAQMTAQQTQAQADLLKMVPTTAAIAAALANSGLALTAAQIAAGVSSGTVQVVPTTTCPSGYRYATGTCVPGSATGQWFSFATNSQVMTYGLVIVAALIIVPALSGGGGRRRR